ncbi:hypothetical protein WN51_08272 [Melipona quadrifasciata]|uniref:Uncharacterized protein n=1 Tax=Melipona quadrifasciata TaxID=166423 RepID=A0A0M8ZMP8_9HYME|nr:hypothetical protein WN51_08272 [Melipona quadrifasciata]
MSLILMLMKLFQRHSNILRKDILKTVSGCLYKILVHLYTNAFKAAEAKIFLIIRRIHGIKMARRRKSEMKSSVKTSLKYVPVRKSSRQIAKKQLEEKKINGDVLQITYSNDSEDSKSTAEYQNHMLPKKNQNSLRKFNRHKNVSNSNVLVINEECSYSATSLYKKDASESDSQDGIDIIVNQSDKLSPEDVQQVVVGNPNKEIVTESDSAESEIWPEDVIEETIICEEMEVKEEVKNSDYNLKQNDNVVVKEVLVVNNPILETKNFVEYTVIQNENGTEAMLVESDSRNAPNNECYYNTERDACNLQKTKMENSMSALYIDVPMTSNNRNDKSFNLEKSYTHNKGIINDQADLYTNKDMYTRLQESLSRDNVFCKIDNKLADMQISEPSKEIEKLVNDLSNMENIMSPLQIAGNTEKIIPMSIDDESSSSILDKMEQLHQSNNSADNIEKTVTELNNDSCNGKVECENQHLLKSKVLSDKKNGNQRKTVNFQQINEELYGDNEVDSKIDGEDTKLSSSSDNSNDTLLSMNNCKLTEFDTKCNNNTNDIDKKVEFRSRSGSTDTTGSESGSNSSGVRRSSRIRSIGLMKQRSCGRGLVTKPNLDSSKTNVQQEREKIGNNVVSIAQEMKIDNPSESQLDKENNVNKTVNTFESLTLTAATCNTTGYDSDSSKPVKVKSRWRRSSELEMGGSNTGIVSTSAVVFGNITANTSESGSCSAIKSTNGASTDINTSDSISGLTSITNIQSNTDIEQTKEVTTSVNNNNIVQIPKTVGARIPLPMVPEIEDKG